MRRRVPAWKRIKGMEGKRHIKHIVVLSCADSRQSGREGKTVEKFLRANMPDLIFDKNLQIRVVSNAGADANEDVEMLLQRLGRKHVLGVSSAHLTPGCGGAHVVESTPTLLKDREERYGITKEEIYDEIRAWGVSPMRVFRDVPHDPVARAEEQGRFWRRMGFPFISGTLNLQKGIFRAIDQNLGLTKEQVYALKKTPVRHQRITKKELLEGQSPREVVISVSGTNARNLIPEARKPGRLFHFSLTPGKISARTLTSLIYLGHILPVEPAPGSHAPYVAKLRLSGPAGKQFDALLDFADKSKLLQALYAKGLRRGSYLTAA